jgi:hypothetical protein
MSLTQDAAADRRWAAAHSLAERVIDDGMRQRRRRVWLWLSVLIVVLMVGSVLLGVALGGVLPRRNTFDLDDTGQTVQVIAGLALQGLGLIVGIAGFIWARRTGRFITRWRAVAGALNWRERKWVSEQIRTATPVDDEVKKSVVLAIAAQNRRATLGLAPLWAGFALIMVGAGVAAQWVTIAWLQLGVVIALIVLSGFVARDYRRAGAYLDTFGDPVSAAPGR